MRLRFDVEWRITLATAVLFPLLISLGFWQLERAGEKQQLEAEWSQRQSAAPAALSTLRDRDADELVYRGVRLRGEFLEGSYLLLDNRVRQGRFGYEVVGVMALEDGGLALVNRGWLAGDPARRELPDVAWPAGTVTLSGHLYRSPGEPYLLGEQDFSGDWPLVVQALDIDAIAARLRAEYAAELFPLEVRMAAAQPGALLTDWQVVNASPAKHRAYAVQWFSMAAVLLLFWLLRNSNLWSLIRKRRTA